MASILSRPQCVNDDMVTHGNVFCIIGILWEETTSHWWISLSDQWLTSQKASNVELWNFVWCSFEPAVEQTVKLPVMRCNHVTSSCHEYMSNSCFTAKIFYEQCYHLLTLLPLFVNPACHTCKVYNDNDDDNDDSNNGNDNSIGW